MVETGSQPRTLRRLSWRRIASSAVPRWSTNLLHLAKRALPFHASAWATSYEPINAFLNEPSAERRKELTRVWRDGMISQLNVIIITSSIVASLISSSFTWSYFDPAHDESVCVHGTRAAWFSALTMAIASIGAASQQIVALHRLSSYPDNEDMIRRLLGKQLDSTPPPTTAVEPDEESGNNEPPPSLHELAFSQAYLWQIPVMLLNGSLYLFMGGLCVIVYWNVTQMLVMSNPYTWTAIGLGSMFTFFMLFSSFNYFFSSLGLYHWIGAARDTASRSSVEAYL